MTVCCECVCISGIQHISWLTTGTLSQSRSLAREQGRGESTQALPPRALSCMKATSACKYSIKIQRYMCVFFWIHSPITMTRSARRITITSGLIVVIVFECSCSTAACTLNISTLTFLCIVQHVWFANWPFPYCIEWSRSALAKRLLSFIDPKRYFDMLLRYYV